jgi:protein TonB
MFGLRDTRSLAVCLAFSIALHVVAMRVLPGFHVPEMKAPDVLEVRLEHVEPPKVIPPAPQVKPAPALPPKAAPKKEKEARHAALPRPAPPQEAPPIVTPREAPPVPAIIALPQSEVLLRSSPAPEAEPPAPRQEVPRAAAAPAPKADGGSSRDQGATITPPNSSAAYLRNPPPRYPVSARRNGEQGTVTLRVFVTKDGAPANVSVHTTSGSPSLDRAALEAVKTWRFVPARQGTEPVDASVLVPIVFKLDGLS